MLFASASVTIILLVCQGGYRSAAIRVSFRYGSEELDFSETACHAEVGRLLVLLARFEVTP